jgi:RNA polymerase sigma-70 factor (ECF subfamily)
MENNKLTDADLVAKALAGDREAFASLYDRYARLVRAVVYGVAMDWPMVQDMAQESFLRAYKNLARLREPNRFGPWIVGIARQVVRERKRAIRRDRHQFVGNDVLEFASEKNDEGITEVSEETELVLRLLAKLPERERLAIHAFFLQERDVRRTAELLGLSRSGVYALLDRSLARLAALVHRCETNKEAE